MYWPFRYVAIVRPRWPHLPLRRSHLPGLDIPAASFRVIQLLIGYGPPDDAGMTITQLDPADSVAMGLWYDLMVTVTRNDLPDFPTPSRQEATELGRGHRSYSTAARHDATGQIVARTKLSFEADDDTHARQRVTIVEPAHRGRRLGLIVKSANHAYTRAHEPALRVIDAWNAEEHTHMRAVNAMLGFQPVDGWSVFQLSVPAT
jgi:hypothetical protein